MKRRGKINKIFAVEELSRVGIILTFAVSAHLFYQDQPDIEVARLCDNPLCYSQYQTTNGRGWDTVNLGIVASTTGSTGSASDANIILMTPPTC